MTVNEIRANISERGWKLRTRLLISVPGEDPLIGDGPDEATQNISVAVWPSFWNVENSLFDLYDADRNVTVWTTRIPTPEEAARILAEHGVPGTSATVGPADNVVGVL